jgi:hypothetical protein
MKRYLIFELLESKALPGACLVAMTAPLAPSARPVDPLPPPEPEPDPGDLPSDDPPIVYPPLPPSGPVGPG